jgi:hypothetical protein
MTGRARTLAIFVSLIGGWAGLVSAQQPQATLLRGLSLDMACAPASPLVKPEVPIVVAEGRDVKRRLFGTGDALVIRGGTSQGLRTGDEYFLRRVVPDRYSELTPGVYPISVHTSGAVQIIETQAEVSIAVITQACDGVLEGDYLEKYQVPSGPTGQVGTAADFGRPAHLILGDDRRQIASAGHFMVLDRGSDHGLKPGQKLTIFRTTLKGAGPVATIGSATVFTVQPETSVVRIETSLDAVYVGDLVAIHR